MLKLHNLFIRQHNVSFIIIKHVLFYIIIVRYSTLHNTRSIYFLFKMFYYFVLSLNRRAVFVGVSFSKVLLQSLTIGLAPSVYNRRSVVSLTTLFSRYLVSPSNTIRTLFILFSPSTVLLYSP